MTRSTSVFLMVVGRVFLYEKYMANGGKRPGAGRPKGTIARHTLEAQEIRAELVATVKERMQPLIAALMLRAESGDVAAIKEIFDRVFGKASQSVDMTSNGESINQVLVKFIDGSEDNHNSDGV